ncbi:MAG: prephenate dehydratase [Thaumarchaeota archaeon]|nr:prephenate dehydratase [Nitrososphaerota archaeon]MCL5318236.1 prephenate dehydratase [Nitrososphaerota archaeon]
MANNSKNKNQGKLQVAFQGERGAYSEEAVLTYFPPEQVVVKPCRTLYDTFEALQKHKVDYAVVPVENSLEGSINETYDLLLESPLKVCGEIHLRVRHSLIGRPDAKLSDIKTAYSHPQALAQCRAHLRELGVKPVAFYDTAGSVKSLRRRRSKCIAAIASKRAAEIYGMKILREGIEDNQNNYTRFFILGFKDAEPTGEDKTSIVFSAKHVPGALYKALKEFADRNINLTKIESRPTRQKLWEYNFYLDFEGHRTDPKCKQALQALSQKQMLTKILGSYPKAKQQPNNHQNNNGSKNL